MRRDARPFDLAEALARIPRVQRPSLLLRLWQWRHAAVLGVGIPGILTALGITTHPVVPVGILAAVVIGLAATPELRRWVVGRARCIVLPHRVRTTLVRGRICAPDGRLPFIWWTSPTPGGVRLRLRCPLGMRPERIQESAELLCAACRADEVVVVLEPNSRTVIIGLGYAPRGRWWEA